MAQVVAYDAVKHAVGRPTLDDWARMDNDRSLDAIRVLVGPPREHHSAWFLVYADGSIYAVTRRRGITEAVLVTIGETRPRDDEEGWMQNLAEAAAELKAHVALEWDWDGREFARR